MDAESEALKRFEELKPGLLDDDEDARYEVAKEVSRLGRPVLASIMELARNPHPLMREMACFMLREVGEPPEPWNRIYPDGIPILVDLLDNDLVADVRGSAAIALGFHKEFTTLPALFSAADDPSEDVRYGVTHALGCFSRDMFDEHPEFELYRTQAISTLLRLTHDPDDDVRDWATFGLHNMGHDTSEVRKRFWELLDDPHDDVRGEAAAGLGKFGDQTLIPRLRELLKDDEMSHCGYFEAAEFLGDPSLLPEVLAAAKAWKQNLDESEGSSVFVDLAVASLRNAAGGTDDDKSTVGDD